MKISASNMPTPSQVASYADPTTVLLLPAWVLIENVTPKSVDTLISDFVNKSPTNNTPAHELSLSRFSQSEAPETIRDLKSKPCPHSVLILLCSQGRRDARCGQSAPLLRKEFERNLREYGLFRDLTDERPGGVGIFFISHVGGHKYSANVLIYRKDNPFGIDKIRQRPRTNESGSQPQQEEIKRIKGAAQCIWLARVRPEHCQGIVKFTVRQGILVKPEKQLRGGFDRRQGLYSW